MRYLSGCCAGSLGHRGRIESMMPEAPPQSTAHGPPDDAGTLYDLSTNLRSFRSIRCREACRRHTAGEELNIVKKGCVNTILFVRYVYAPCNQLQSARLCQGVASYWGAIFMSEVLCNKSSSKKRS